MFCAVFDLDGTLADTSGDLLDAANSQFVALGMEAPLTRADRNTALLGGRAMLSAGAVKIGLADATQFAIDHYEPFLLHYEANLSTKTRFYDGAIEVIESLRADDWRVAICTNKPVHLAVKLIEELGATHLFDALIGANSIPERKPDPTPLLLTINKAGGAVNRTVMIGDTDTDYNAAKNAGTDILLVDFDDTNIGVTFPDSPLVNDFSQLHKYLTAWREKF